MKLLFKLLSLGVMFAALTPLIAPQSPVADIVRAAFADVTSFCDRRPEACHEGARVARETGAALKRTLSDLTSETDGGTLSAADRALAPPESAQDRKSAFAGHGDFTY